MPQITVEYSASLTEAFDRRGFALALHPAAAELIGSAPADFKTRFLPIAESVIGDGADTEAMIHVKVQILPGRQRQLQDRLGDLTLAMLCEHLKPVAGQRTQVTVEVSELGSYHKRVLTG